MHLYQKKNLKRQINEFLRKITNFGQLTPISPPAPESIWFENNPNRSFMDNLSTKFKVYSSIPLKVIKRTNNRPTDFFFAKIIFLYMF